MRQDPVNAKAQMTDPDARPPETEPPFNPLPTAVIVLAAVILGIEVLFTLGLRGLIGGPDAIGWRLTAVRDWAFADVVFEWMRAGNRYPPEHLARFVTYTLIHTSFTHAVFVIVVVLALGKLVSEVFGGFQMLVVFFASATLGALAYGLILNEEAPLVGGYPGVYGLIGAYTYLLLVELTAVGGNKARAFTLIGVFLGLQLIFAVFFDGPRDWVADLAGFCAGFLLSFVVSPGGWRRLLARLRDR